MYLKTLLIGSVAAVVSATAAQAADPIYSVADPVFAPETEAVEYVRVCDAYGAGYFYIPGTETCLRLSGYVRYDMRGGDDVYTDTRLGGWHKHGRFTFRTNTASETDLGTLKTFTETRFNWDSEASGIDGYYGGSTYNPLGQVTGQSENTELRFAYITLGGFKVGIDDSEFHTFTGYLGDVINDDVVNAGSYRTGKISYTFNFNQGFSAVLALEEGGKGYVIDEYIPHIVGGLKYEQAWGKIAAVMAYDSVIEDWSAKLRFDVNVTSQLSLWAQGGYSGSEECCQNYGSWGGNWAVWGGAQYKASNKATFNLQAAYQDWGKAAVTANVAYQLVPGFTITPEVSYTNWKRNYGGVEQDASSAWQGLVRFQRSF